MKKRTKRICAFFLNLLLVVVMVQQGLVVSDASSSSAITQTEQSDTASDSSQGTASDSEADSVQTDQSSTDSDQTVSDSSTGRSESVIASSTDSTFSAADTSSSSGEISSDSAADVKNADNGDNNDSSDENDISQSVTKENDYTVTVNYGEDAGIPEDAKLQVTEITDESAVEDYTIQAESALSGTAVSAARFFDISFVSDGQEVEPKADVDVEITLADSLDTSDGTNVKAVHFDETSGSDSPEVLDVTTSKDSAGNVEKVQFTQSSFSVTGVVSWNDTNLPVDGTYVMVVNAGDKFYAVKADGTLTPVQYLSEGSKVTFPNLMDTSAVKDYEWDLLTLRGAFGGSGKCIMHGVANNASYIDPSADSAVVTGSSDYPTNLPLFGYTDFKLVNNSIFQYGTSGNAGRIVTLSDYRTLAIDNGVLTGTTYTEDNADNALKVYFAKNFSVDGSDDPGTPSGEDPVENLTAPDVHKILTDNENGTYNLSLSIKGQAKSVTEKTKAQVLVVLDTSSSMSKSSSISNTRLDNAKDALHTLAENLLSKNTGDAPDRVQMSMFTFNNVANNDWTKWTNSKSEFDSELDNVKAEIIGTGNETGTNWEDALNKANNIEFAKDVEKYVIFVSDGNPTFYNTAYGNGIDQTGSLTTDSGSTTYNELYGVWGTGTDSNEINVRRSYERARGLAKDIVKSGKHFYTISAFQDVSRMESLTAYAYSGSDAGTYPAQHYQEATDLDSLTAAFDNIVSMITKDFHYSDVQFTDQLTSMTSTTNAVDFTYTVTDAEGNTHTCTFNDKDNTYSYKNSDGVKKFHSATYNKEDGTITWNMNPDDSTHFILDDGYTYTVSFTVWPNQQAYDLVADLNNGLKTYDDDNNPKTETISDDEKSQIVPVTENGNTTYRLKTNKDGTNVTYKTAETKTENGTSSTVYGDQQKYDITNPDPVPLAEMQVTITKVWEDASDSSDRPDSIQVNVIRDKGSGNDVSTLPTPLILFPGNEWKATYYISPGLFVTGIDEKNPLNPGHTYDIEEVGLDPHYELETETYHPFLIDSNSTIYNGTSTENDEGKSTKLSTLTAINRLRGFIQLEKKVTDSSGKDITTITKDGQTVVNPAIADETFTYTMKLVSPGDHTSVDDDGNLTDYQYEYFDQTKYGGTEYNYKKAINETGGIIEFDSAVYDSKEDKTTVTATVTLKPHEQFRMINVPIGTTYIFTEDDKVGYTFASAAINDGDSITDASKIISTTEGNQNDSVVVTNKAEKLDVKLTKTDNSNPAKVLNGAEFSLKKVVTDSDGKETETTAYKLDGTEISSVTVSSLSDIGDLPTGTYRLTETRAPDGYSLLPDAIIFTADRTKIGTADAVKITAGASCAAVSYEKADTEAADDDYYKITVQNTKIYELPSFGGHGIYWNTILGTLIAIFFAYAGFSVKHEKRGGEY